MINSVSEDLKKNNYNSDYKEQTEHTFATVIQLK